MPTDNQGPVYPGTQPTQQVPPEPPTQTYYRQSSAQQAAGQQAAGEVPPAQTTQAYAQPATGQAYAQQPATGQAYAQQVATGQVPPTQVPPIPGAGAGAGAPKPKKPHLGIKPLVFGLIGGILGAAGVVAALNFGGFFDRPASVTTVTNAGQSITIDPSSEDTSLATAVAAKCLPSVVSINVQTNDAEGVGSGVALDADGISLPTITSSRVHRPSRFPLVANRMTPRSLALTSRATSPSSRSIPMARRSRPSRWETRARFRLAIGS